MRVFNWIARWLYAAAEVAVGTFLRPSTVAYATGPGHGKDVTLSVDVGGTPKAIGPYVREVSFSVDGQVVDITGMGASTWRTFLAGLKGATMTVSGVWNDTADVGTAVVIPAIILVEGTVSYVPISGITVTGEALMTGYTIDTSLESETTFTANFTFTGAVTVS